MAAGVYLVSRVAHADANARYACDPFLVSVPDTGSNAGGGGADGSDSVTYDVTAEPKFADLGEPGQPVPKPPAPGTTANTDANIGVYAVVALCAFVVGAAGLAGNCSRS